MKLRTIVLSMLMFLVIHVEDLAFGQEQDRQGAIGVRIGKVQVSDSEFSNALSVGFTYLLMLEEPFFMEFGIDQYKTEVAGGSTGELTVIPLTLTVKFKHRTGLVVPYYGHGFGYYFLDRTFIDPCSAFICETSYHDAFGFHGVLGFDRVVAERAAFNFELKYIYILEAKVTNTITDLSTGSPLLLSHRVDLDSFVFGAGLKLYF